MLNKSSPSVANADAQPAVLFDLDGTLIDTAPDFIRIIRAMCREQGLPLPSEALIREQVSAGGRAMVRVMFAEQGANLADDDPVLVTNLQEFLQRYAADICVDSRVYDGLLPLLTTLDKNAILWGIVTNKPRMLSEKLLAAIGLAERCAVLVCADDVANPKPDPEPLYLAAKQLGVPPSACLYIGDHLRDIQAGKAAHMPTIAAAYGYLLPGERDTVSDWQADAIAPTPQALAQLVQDWLNIDHDDDT